MIFRWAALSKNADAPPTAHAPPGPGRFDGLQVAVLVEEPRVAGVDPLALQGLGGGLRVLVVALEDARAPLADLPARAHPRLDPRQGRPHRVELHVAVGLDADQ